MGKTNVPEFAAGSQTFNQVFGPTRNPYNLDLTCGGSSGGAAAALACGFVPLADGSDMGGSLRNPASFCNIVGLRPSIGVVPQYPVVNGFDVLCASGPMARSVEDVGLLLNAICGEDPRDPCSFRQDSASFSGRLEHDFSRARIAWSPNLGCLPVAPEVIQVIQKQLDVFSSFGCEVEEATPDLTGAHEAFHTLRGMIFETTYGHLYPDHKDALKDTVRWNLELGRNLTAPKIAQAQRLQSQCFAKLSQFLTQYDFLVTPVSQVLPFPVEQEYVTEINAVPMGSYIDWMSASYYISVTGHPAISVPCGFSQTGLPVGVQIVGRYRRDLDLLRIAYMFEQSTRFATVRPVFCDHSYDHKER